MENTKYIGWIMADETVKKFPFKYIVNDFELGDNEKTQELFEKYTYLIIGFNGNLYGTKKGKLFNITTGRKPLNENEMKLLDETYIKVD